MAVYSARAPARMGRSEVARSREAKTGETWGREGQPWETEAARAGYAWLEMLSLRDLLRWCGEGDAAGVRSRLSGVAGRLVASPEELSGVVGEGVLLPGEA